MSNYKVVLECFFFFLLFVCFKQKTSDFKNDLQMHVTVTQTTHDCLNQSILTALRKKFTSKMLSSTSVSAIPRSTQRSCVLLSHTLTEKSHRLPGGADSVPFSGVLQLYLLERSWKRCCKWTMLAFRRALCGHRHGKGGVVKSRLLWRSDKKKNKQAKVGSPCLSILVKENDQS